MNKSKSLFYSFLDGIFASIMTGLTLNYVTPFGLVLGATNIHIGLLNALPQLISSVAQLYTSEVVERLHSRLKVITTNVYLHGVTFLVIVSLVFLKVELRIYWFIILITLSNMFNATATPAWLSLMSDTVDKNKYGEYFAWRGKVLGVISLVVSFLAGMFLSIVKNKFYGFVILFIFAGVMRLISGYFISLMEDVPVVISKEKVFSYIDFIKRVKESNFVKYVLFVSLLNFSVFISAPFFNVYMLSELKFTYFEYTIVTLSSAVSSLLFLSFWGKTADRIGNVKIIKICGLLISFLPAMWLFSKNLFYLVIINAFAGYVWSGFNLATVNFIFDAASQEVRTRCISYFNFTNGIFIFLGTMLSGVLASVLPAFIYHSRLLTLFLLSSILRFFVVLYFHDKFHEVRKIVEYVETKEFLFTILGVKPIMDFSKDIFHPVLKKLNKK